MNTWDFVKDDEGVTILTLNGAPIGSPFRTYQQGLGVAVGIIHAGHQGGEFAEADFIAAEKAVDRATRPAAQAA